MAGSAQTLSNVVPILKEVTTKLGLLKQFDEGHFLLDIIEHGDQGSPKVFDMMAEFDGKYIRLDAHTAGNPNVAVGVPETSGYPKEGSQDYDNLKYRGKRMVSSLGMTIETMSRAPGDPQSSFRIASKEMIAIMENTRKRMNYYCHQDGSGLLSTLPAASGWNTSTKKFTIPSTAELARLPVGTEFIVRSLTGSSGPTGVDTFDTGTAWSATSGVKIPAKVTAVDVTNKTITATYYDDTAIPQTTVGDMSAYGIYSWDQQGEVCWGLAIACSDANPSRHGWLPTGTPPTDSTGLSKAFGAIDRNAAGNEWWKAVAAKDLGGAAINIQNDIQPLQNTLIGRDSTLRGQDAIMCVLADNALWALINELEAGKRTAVRTTIVDGKYEVVRYGIFTFGWDPDSTSNTALFFAPKNFYRMVISTWDWEDLDSRWTQMLNSFSRPTSKHRMELCSEQQLICGSCLGNSKFTNVAA